jgi:hypothetical protein
MEVRVSEIESLRTAVIADIARARLEQAVLWGIHANIDAEIEGLLRLSARLVGVGYTDAPAAATAMRARFAVALVHARAGVRCARRLGLNTGSCEAALAALRGAARGLR